MATRFFADTLRAKPLQLLLSQVRKKIALPVVADLGCGDGYAIPHIRQHWPDARIVCIDSSKDKLKDAMANCIDSNVRFVHTDVRAGSDVVIPDEGINVVFANSSLHHFCKDSPLLPEIWDLLPGGGVLAAQSPVVSAGSTYARLLSECMREAGMAGPPAEEGGLLSPQEYDGLMHEEADQLHSWSTEEHHFVPQDQLLALLVGSGVFALQPEEVQALSQLFGKRYAEEHAALPSKRFAAVIPRFYLVASKKGPGSL